MADAVTGLDAKPAAGHCCKFELKKYKTEFMCQVCRVDSYDTKRYHCSHCGEDRHEGCIQLADKIKVGPGANNIFSSNPVFKLFKYPQQGSNSKNKTWAKNCLVCGMAIKLYSYYSQTTQNKDLNMHPCCAELARFHSRAPLPHKLQTSEEQNCLVCGMKRPRGASPNGPKNFYCWSYKLSASDRIHVHCYREMMIQALKNSVRLGDCGDDNNHNEIRIVLKRRRDKNSKELEGILEGAINIAQEALGIGFMPILLDCLA